MYLIITLFNVRPKSNIKKNKCMTHYKLTLMCYLIYNRDACKITQIKLHTQLNEHFIHTTHIYIVLGFNYHILLYFVQSTRLIIIKVHGKRPSWVPRSFDRMRTITLIKILYSTKKSTFFTIILFKLQIVQINCSNKYVSSVCIIGVDGVVDDCRHGIGCRAGRLQAALRSDQSVQQLNSGHESVLLRVWFHCDWFRIGWVGDGQSIVGAAELEGVAAGGWRWGELYFGRTTDAGCNADYK